MILDGLPIYATVIAVVLLMGETLILVRTDKYWPLSVDDYVVCLLLLYTAATFESQLSRVLMLVAWALMAGNLYAMLFTRMDPKTGTRERLGALTVLLVAALLGIVMSVTVLV